MDEMTMSKMGWISVDAADEVKKNRIPVDLWVVGSDSMVDFYAPLAVKMRGKPVRHGRAANFVWAEKWPNPPNWYPIGGLSGYPLSPEVTATHFMLHFPPPIGQKTMIDATSPASPR